VTFSLLPQVTHAWRRRGTVKRVPTPGANVKVPIFGAYRWPDGPFLYARGDARGGVNTNLFLDLVRQLARHARRVRRIVVLVLDHGSAQTSRRSEVVLLAQVPQVVVFWLPRYSSEQLNDIENLWRHVKDDYFSEMLVTRRDDFPTAVDRLFRSLRRVGRLRRFLKPRPGGKKLR
jgi:transposase